MSGMASVLAGILLVVGALFALVGAIGVLRFPDLYTRMHAASKAGTLGSGILLLALAVAAQQYDVGSRAVAGIVFLLLTAPVSAHLLARAAVSAGVRPCPGTALDDVSDHPAVRFRGGAAGSEAAVVTSR